MHGAASASRRSLRSLPPCATRSSRRPADASARSRSRITICGRSKPPSEALSGAAVEHRLVGTLLLRHVERVVVLLGEGHAARHDGAGGELAGEPHGDGVAGVLPTVDRANASRIGDVLCGDLDDREFLLAAVALAHFVLREHAFELAL